MDTQFRIVYMFCVSVTSLNGSETSLFPMSTKVPSTHSLAFTNWLCSNDFCKDLKFGFDRQWRTTFYAIAWKILVWSGGVELFFMQTLFSLLILIGGLLMMLKLLSLLSI
ncbi:hypothetical protein E1A91_A08G098400v1 [Gossypium mustelinum]|uniref:Transmembrane protein n=1 Tax=Gossypium mustelinum TaxID=34275 RepID=A0A5D2Y6G5_GOSMU|nr:hypothetical protein E1A91_A08G098400v1 [Gossypium mustelinum]